MSVLVNLGIEAQYIFRSPSTRYNIYLSIDREVYSGLSQIPKMKLFANRRNDLKPLTIFK